MYKGDILFGDGTEENANKELMGKDRVEFDCTFYLPAYLLSPELAANYTPIDYVSVNHSADHQSHVAMCGETLDRKFVSAVFDSEDGCCYENIKVDKKGYYHFCLRFGDSMTVGNDVGIVEVFYPAGNLTAQTKKAEYNQDVLMVTVVIAIFALLYIITSRWIRTLERSVDFLRKIASGIAPEKEIHLGRTLRLSGLERQLNILREINMDRMASLSESSEKE